VCSCGLTFCDLRCSYCDTEYAFYEGKKKQSTCKEIVEAVQAFHCPLVEITGGEPVYCREKKRAGLDVDLVAMAGSTVAASETSGAPRYLKSRSTRFIRE